MAESFELVMTRPVYTKDGGIWRGTMNIVDGSARGLGPNEITHCLGTVVAGENVFRELKKLS